ncbi:MAG: class I tRNA ligase family protein [Candidatus Cloacimonadaceae bacterium]|nr:class I tRNA ligase family protein [Candidatus Cloacimonadaceae bacterium]
MQYNTAIASAMELLNAIIKIREPEKLNPAEQAAYAFACSSLPKMLYLFAPHIAEELWQVLQQNKLLHESGLPVYDPQHLIRNSITYVVQINGKIRGKLEVAADTDADTIKALALAVENVQRSLDCKQNRINIYNIT